MGDVRLVDVTLLNILQSFRLSTEGCCLDKEVWLIQSPAQLCQFKLLRRYIQLSPGSNKTKAKYTNPCLWSQRPSYASAEQGKAPGSLQLLTSCLHHTQIRFNNYHSTFLNYYRTADLNLNSPVLSLEVGVCIHLCHLACVGSEQKHCRQRCLCSCLVLQLLRHRGSKVSRYQRKSSGYQDTVC